MISNLYWDVKTVIITEEGENPVISVRRGVLQGRLPEPSSF